jgi:hypothetical protein
MNGDVDTAVQFFLPASIVVPFPVTSTSEWYDSTTIVNIFMGMEFTSATSIDTTTVEGYGTLITPYGTAEALRLHNKEISCIPGSPIFDISNDLDFVTAVNQVSPNPFNDFFEVKINMIDGDDVECRLISMNGYKSPVLKKEYLPSGFNQFKYQQMIFLAVCIS